MSAQNSICRHIVDCIISYEGALEFTRVLHPKNAADQKRKFLAGDIENPMFQYKDISVPQIKFPELPKHTPLYQLYLDRMHHTEVLGSLLQSVGNNAVFTELSEQLFPVHNLAIDVPDYQNTSDDSPLLHAKEIAEKFTQALQQLSLHNWQVCIQTGISSRMFVNQWKHLIGIRDDVQVTQQEAERLTKHEIGVHVLRAANGCRQTEPLLHVGTHKGRLFEEGVACFQEDSSGPARIFLRHYAVQLAQKSSFRDVWQNLCNKHVPAEVAWSMTLRVKRGLQNTSNPGAFTRDAVYAQAFMEMKKYIQQGGDIAPLLSAPIHPDEIQYLTDNAHMTVFKL